MARIILTGASGRLGLHVLRAARRREVDLVTIPGRTAPLAAGPPGERVDLGDASAVERFFTRHKPGCVIHAAAWTDVDGCETDPARCREQLVEVTANVARAAAMTGSRVIFISTDYVFGGDDAPYFETDPVSPINQYGKAKAEAERVVATTARTSLVLRGTFIGHATPGRVGWVERLLRNEPVVLDDTRHCTPLTTSTFAKRVLAHAVAAEACCGIRHIRGPARLTTYGLGQALAKIAGCRIPGRAPGASLTRRSPCPRDSSLETLHPLRVPPLEQQLLDLVRMHPQGIDVELAGLVA